MSIPLSSEQDKRNYAKEMTSELEMFAENNNGQNLQNSTKGGGKSLLLRNCHYLCIQLFSQSQVSLVGSLVVVLTNR